MNLTPSEFVHRWRGCTLSERSASQSHFIDLCEMLGQKHPVAADSIGESFTFEKYVGKARGGKGYADVWKRDYFAWEYKGKHKDLKKAYNQLNDYREELGNPPLLVVCDMDRFQIHTNFTATYKRVYEFTLDDLNENQITASCPVPPLGVLRALFGDYNVLRPERTDAQVTQEAARLFSRLAERLELEDRNLGASRAQVAHFLMRLLFCLFADSIGLLPGHLFRRLIQEDRSSPKRFLRKLAILFEAMSEPDGIFGEHSIKYFNGGLFDTASILPLDQADLGILYDVSRNYDWSHVAPAIFGTLFQRSLDPQRRSLIGAHYTSEEDILLIIEPVLMRPLHRRWEEAKTRILDALEAERAQAAIRNSRQANRKVQRGSERILSQWIEELTSIRVLDPACGSGNFLYLALRRMLDLWLEGCKFALEHGISLVLPKMVSPQQLYGIETEFYAHELASIVVWIGFLQWKHEHGVEEDRQPVLQKLTNIEHADAILGKGKDGKPFEPKWPQVDFIIGNPPFLGGNKLREELPSDYVDALQRIYAGRVSAAADLVTYWFEKSRALLPLHDKLRIGLLATQSIRGGVNRRVLENIKETGDIFMAWSDRPWLLDGAVVRVSMIGFDLGTEDHKVLDGSPVSRINADLTSAIDLTSTEILKENAALCFRTDEKGGPFEITPETALRLISAPRNVNGRPNSDVIRRWVNATDVTGHDRGLWIIDFHGLNRMQAAQYEWPFETLKKQIADERRQAEVGDRVAKARPRWWLHRRPGSEMRRAIANLDRYVTTIATGKHRLFIWLDQTVLPDHQLYVIARQDDYFFGVLHSSAHEIWARAKGTQTRDADSGCRYTPTSTFETFPFPWPPGAEPSEEHDRRVKAIADAARRLVRLRNVWLDPIDADPIELRKRTLTNLYNMRPDWLENAHQDLDRAVFSAYGLPQSAEPDQILGYLLALNHKRASKGAGLKIIPKKIPVSEPHPDKNPLGAAAKKPPKSEGLSVIGVVRKGVRRV